MDPKSVSVSNIAEFLNWLFEVRKLSVSSIKGYGSAIARVMKRSTGADIFQDDVLSGLISNFQIERIVLISFAVHSTLTVNKLTKL